MKSVGADSEAVQRQLVAMLFDQTTTLIIGGLVLPIAAALCWVRTGQAWFLLWASLMVVTLAARLVLQWTYYHRHAGAGGFRTWRVGFIVGAWVTGGTWGVAALTIVKHEDPLVQMFVISAEAAIIMGAATRNASCPLAARGQTLLGLAPLFVAFIATDDPYYLTLSVFVVFTFFTAQTFVHHLFDQHVRFLCMNEENLMLVREVRQANLGLAAANRQLEHAAMTDSLTGIANRRRFDSALADEVRRAQRARTGLALLLLDIDLFKGFNDHYGHQAGDECLRRVAQTLSSAFRRPADLVARYGGEEFAVILPQTNGEAALALAEVVRRDIEVLGLKSPASPAGIISVSIGIASFSPGQYQRPQDFIRGADEALYAAKGAGRNCVRGESESESSTPPAGAGDREARLRAI